MNVFRTILLSIAFVATVAIPNARAEAASIEDMLATIESLLAQIKSLQTQLNEVRGELKDTLKEGLEEGMTDDDIAKVQELLASDPSIYPQKIVTGYFGPLTRQALIRFQERHELKPTGRLDEDTRAMIEEYFAEKFGEDIPPGLLRAPGIRDKIENRIRIKCDNSGRGSDELCKALRKKYKDDDAEDDDDDSDEEESNDDSDDSSDDEDDANDDDSDSDDDSDDDES